MNFITENIKKCVLKNVSLNGLNLAQVKPKFKNNTEVVTVAVKQNVEAINFASETLKNDENFIYSLASINLSVLKVLQNNVAIKVLDRIKKEKNIKIITDELYNTKIILDSLNKIKWALNFENGLEILSKATEEMRDNKNVVMMCVKSVGQALYYASDRLKNDSDIVLEAVKNDGLSLSSASKELRNREEIVKQALQNNAYALRFASDRLKNDRDLVFYACVKEPFTIINASSQLRNDIDFICEIARKNSLVLNKIPRDIYRLVIVKLQKDENWEEIISKVK